MLNQIVLVGRLAKNPEIIKENEKEKAVITLAVPRSYKNAEGIYETDFIRCSLWNGIAQNTYEYCKKGDLVGIRGRLQVRNYQDEEETRYITEVVAERVTFLSSKKLEEV